MVRMIQRMVYKAFGLNVSSELPLPELPKLNSLGEKVDIVIELGDITNLWSELAEPDRFCIVKDHSVIIHIPNIAIYCIEYGNHIIVSPLNNANEDQVRLYILGSCMGALLMQRRILPLHGSAIVINDKAYAIVGDSGAGKSTLASAFLNKGYQLLSDDVIPISLSDENLPIVKPAYPQQKLWQESLDAFGMASNDYRPIFARETKFTVPVVSQFSSKPYPLAGVFELVKTEEDEIKIMPIQNLQQLHTLFYHTYRNFLIDHLGLREWHFSMTARIANQIQVYQLQRPMNQFTAQELTSVILNTINREVVKI